MCFELNISLFFILHFLYFEEISVSHYSYLYLYNQQQQNFSKLIAKKKQNQNHEKPQKFKFRTAQNSHAKIKPKHSAFYISYSTIYFPKFETTELAPFETHTHTKLNKTHTKTW